MAVRRAISLALPAGDPRSALILDLLDALPVDADTSAELRRLIVAGAGVDQRLADLAAQVATLATAVRDLSAEMRDMAATGVAPREPTGPAVDAASLAMLLDFS